jgi:7-cyano-7-deazaguanine synthase in queuosine biosynthesis
MKTILLFSGGVDSYVAWHYLGKPATVYFDLRSRYTLTELIAVRKLIPTTLVDISLNLSQREQPSAYVPFRNLLLACQAAHYGDEIVMAGNADDVVSDKTEGIFKEFSDLLSKLEGREIRVTSPFWHMSKRELVRWYLDNVGDVEPLRQTVACYSGREYCGACKSCFRKWVALYLNGIEMEFSNSELMDEYLSLARTGVRYTEQRNADTIEAIERYRENRR